ncbi:MAG TPA: glycosyltransferase, partial [Actinomycetota bacterium]|nr:glycosyltransferase [Actinomycetota bacterium]
MRRDEVLETPRMARASASLFASDVVAALAYFAFALLVARLAGPAARGAVAFVTAVPLLLAYASTLGLDAANLFHAGREPALRPVLVTASAVVCVLAGSAFAAAAWGVFDLSPGLVPGSVSDALLAAGLAITGLMTVQIALDAALIGSGETASANLVRIVVPITAVVLYAGTAAVTGRSGAAIAVAAWVVSRAAGCVLALVLSARRIGLAGPRELRRATPRLLRYGLPAHVGSLADLPIRRFDTLMLGASRGAAELGIYTAAVNGAEVMFYLPTAAGSVLLPAAAPLDAAAARSLTRRVLLIVVTATGLAAAFVAATAPFLVRVLFGPEFAESVLPLRILALGVVGASIRIVLEGALLARRRQALSSAVTVLTLVVIVALDVVLIPRYGAVGAAAASTAAYWVAAVFMYAAFRRAVPRDGAAPRLRDEARSAWAMVASLVRRPAADTPLPPGPVPLAPLPERPLVSVLVSSYCYAQYLGDAIESVLGQTYERFEVVVCDDGSTDGSRAVLEEYARRDARVVAVTKENGGQASALNAAFCASSGEIVCFLDADDMLDPGRLEAVVDALAGGDAGGVVHPFAVYDEEWNELYTLPVGYRPESGWIGARAAARGGRWSVAAGGGVAFRRAVAERVFPIPEDAFTGADADAFVFTLLPLLTPVAHVPQPLYRYRLHGENEGLLRRLDPPSVERRLRFIETTTACVNERLAQLDPPGTALRLEDNLGYEEQRFFLDAFAARRPRAGRDVRFGRLLRRIARDDVYTPARKAGLLLLYSAIVVLPRGSRSGVLSLVRRVSYRARALLRPRAIVLWGLVPAAAVVTMLGIGRESFFLDEVASLSFARLGT